MSLFWRVFGGTILSIVALAAVTLYNNLSNGISDLRAEHQVAQLRAGAEPDDHVDPGDLSPLMRAQLKEAFRAVSSVQRRLASELSLGVR